MEEIEEEEEPEEEDIVQHGNFSDEDQIQNGDVQDLSTSFISQLSRRSKRREISESTPLMTGSRMTLRRSMSRHRTRSMSVGRKGDATEIGRAHV